MSIKVSIIIPVYNMEEYLRECLDSIINQTLQDIEIICINDGSTDNSLSILYEYKEKDNRIKIINQDNKGTGIARNNGIKIAVGEYIGFVDPDDWISLDYYEKLYKIANQKDLDIVCAKNRIEYLSKTEQKIFKINNKFLKKELILRHISLWNKIFKKDFINQYNFENLNTKCSQDLPFTIGSIISTNKIGIADTTYYYRVLDTSAYHKKNKDYQEIFQIYNYIDNFISKLHLNPCENIYINIIMNKRKIKSFIDWYNKVPDNNKKEFLMLMKNFYPNLFNKFCNIINDKQCYLTKISLKLKTILKKYPIKLSLKERLLLCKYLKKSDSYLEFGAGGSTFLALLHSKTKIYSVESDKNWINYLRKWKIITKAEEFQKLIFNYVDIGKTKEWGFPVDDTEKDKFPDYSKAVFEKYSNIKFDTVFIDGRFRVACTLAAILNTSLNSIIILHDYANRKGYHIIERFLDKIESANTMVVFRKKNNINLAEVNQLYEEYKYIAD